MALWTYLYTELAQKVTAKDIINLVGLYLIGGVTISAIFNPNPK